MSVLLPSAPALGAVSGHHRVLDTKTGIVKTLGHLYRNPGDPALNIVMSNITAFHRFSRNRADFAATGAAPGPSGAHWSALGESVERYCAALSDFHTLVYGSWKRLSSEGRPLMSPHGFTLFADHQYQDGEFPFSKPDTAHRISWIRGERLEDGAALLVPAALVFNQFRQGRDEIKICPDIHPGVAGGLSREQALTGAMLEIVERDTMMIHWLNRLPVTGIRIDSYVTALLRPIQIPAHLDLHLAWLQTDFELPCVFALLLDERKGLLGGGCAAGFLAERAAVKAVCEAVQTLYLSREIRRGRKGKLGFRSGAVSAAFLDPDRRKKLPMTQLLFNLGFYLTPDNWDGLKDLRSPRKQVALDDIAGNGSKCCRARDLVQRFVALGLSPVSVDLTTPDVAEQGWVVVRVTAPGAVPNLATLYPPLALSRLRSVPGKLKLDAADSFNNLPMPYA